jgi:hypothetical protein
MAKKSTRQPRTYGPGFASSFNELPGFMQFIQQSKAIVNYIVGQIVSEMNATVAAEGKSFSDAALEEWTPKLRKAVLNKLLDGGNWDDDKANVLQVAHDMAWIASILSGSSSTVAKAHVHAAFRACKDHSSCPGSSGSGRWCDFDI